MSYARIGEFGSDVYVWSDGVTLYCEAEGKVYECATHQEMIDHLLMHRRRRHHVPQEALDRLTAERDGIPYETDVEAALRALKDGGSV